MIEIYLKSEKESDIQLFDRFAAIGYVSMTFELNNRPAVPELVDTVMHEGSRCKIARFPDFSGDTQIRLSVAVRNDEVPLPTVSGDSETNAMEIFTFAKISGPDGKQVACDWKNAELLMSDGA